MSSNKTMELLGKLETMMDEAQAPIMGGGGRKLVDTAAALDVIDEIRATFPPELDLARQIVNERQHLMDDAHSQASEMLESAKEKVKVISSEQEVVRLAQLQAKKIMEDADEFSEQTRASAENYAAEVLGHVEQSLAALLNHTAQCKTKFDLPE